jgi:hypothetical protein
MPDRAISPDAAPDLAIAVENETRMAAQTLSEWTGF